MKLRRVKLRMTAWADEKLNALLLILKIHKFEAFVFAVLSINNFSEFCPATFHICVQY